MTLIKLTSNKEAGRQSTFVSGQCVSDSLHFVTQTLREVYPASTHHLYIICTMLDQRQWVFLMDLFRFVFFRRLFSGQVGPYDGFQRSFNQLIFPLRPGFFSFQYNIAYVVLLCFVIEMVWSKHVNWNILRTSPCMYYVLCATVFFGQIMHSHFYGTIN